MTREKEHASSSASRFPVKPFLRWAGSKRSLLHKLKDFLPEKYERYIEPFAGSAAFFFHLSPTSAILSDLNPALIQTLRAVRDQPAQTALLLSKMPVDENAYYNVRAIDPKTLSPVERAARFIYLNRFCFNGLYRTNAKGQFNVPYGRPKTHSVPTESLLTECASRLRRAKLVCGDFERVLRGTIETGDLVYLDPPFYRSARRVFREYTAAPFSAEDLGRLCDLLSMIDRSGAMFVLSYASCREAREAFASWNIRRVRTHRSISGPPAFRKHSEELVVTNYRSRVSR